MKVTKWLWSNPDLPYWQRLLLSPFYILYLSWCVLIGERVVVVKDNTDWCSRCKKFTLDDNFFFCSECGGRR